MARKRKSKNSAKPSPAIMAMQREMLAAGQYTGPIDGLSGPKYEKAIVRRDKAAERESQKSKDATQLALAKAEKAKAEAATAQAKGKAQDNSPFNKLVTLGGQAAAVAVGAYAGHKIASGTRQYMLTAQLAANRQLIDLGAKAAPMVNKGITTTSKARYAQALAGQLKIIKSPKTIVAGVALSSFLAADAAYSHFVGRQKAKESGSKSALMAVDAFTATTALASTANLAYTVKEAVMPGVQKATVAAAQVKAAAAMADDFLANPKAATISGQEKAAKTAKSVPKPGSVAAMRAEAKQLGLKVTGTGKGGRVNGSDLKAALEKAAKVTGKANSNSPWKLGNKIAKAAGKLPGSAKMVGLTVAGGAAIMSLGPKTASASEGDKQVKKTEKSTPNLVPAIVGGAMAGAAYMNRKAILSGAKVAGKLIGRASGPVGWGLAAYDVGKFAYNRHQQNEHVKTLPRDQRQAWADDKIKKLNGGEMKMRFDSFSPDQKAKFNDLDRSGRKSMLDQVDMGAVMASKRQASGMNEVLNLTGNRPVAAQTKTAPKNGTGFSLISSAHAATGSHSPKDSSKGKAYLNDGAKAKAGTGPKPTASVKRGGDKAAAAGTSTYTKKDGTTVQVSAKQAAAYRKLRK